MLDGVAWGTVRGGVRVTPAWEALLRGDGVAASATFDRASRRDPDDPWVWRGLGLAMAEREIEVRAIHHLHRALALEPDHAETWYWVGQFAPRDTHADVALRALRRAVELRPGEADYHAALAGRLAGEHALAELERALSINPGHAEALRTSAWVLERLGRADDAVDAAEQLVSRLPTVANLGALSRLLERVGRRADAERADARRTRRALVDDAFPRGLEEFGAIARLLLDRRQLENLRGSFAAGASVSPWEPGFWLGMARAMIEAGRSAEAMPLLDRLAESDPDGPLALAVGRERAAALSRLGRHAEAETALEVVRMLEDFRRWDEGDPYALAGAEVPADGFRARWRTWPAALRDPWTDRVQPPWTGSAEENAER